MKGAHLSTANEPTVDYGVVTDVEEVVADLEKQMKAAAGELDFEKAAHLRDEITRLRVESSV